MNDADNLQSAARLLRRGGVVAFPTETVYGLGADATNASAARRIFEIKGRPATNPLIVHVASEAIARRYAAHWPDAAPQLTARFWPGPLTLVVPKNPVIVDEVTAGLKTVGLRAPNHPLALELLRVFDGPLAGPSANRSNRVSPTAADHVRQELGDSVDLILDGGPCRVGIESTVLDLSGTVPTILRPGGVTRKQIESVIGPVELALVTLSNTTPAVSPGQQAVHYAPHTPAIRFETAQRGLIPAENAGILAVGPGEKLRQWGPNCAMPNRPEAYAREFYRVLRMVDGLNLRTIYIEMPPDTPDWAAVRDRIRRATQPLRTGST